MYDGMRWDVDDGRWMGWVETGLIIHQHVSTENDGPVVVFLARGIARRGRHWERSDACHSVQLH